MLEFDKDLLFEIAADDGMILLDDLDEAIVGLCSRCGSNTVVAYNINKIIEILMEREEMSYSEALDHYSFNIEGSHYGDMSPAFVRLLT